MDYKDYKQGLTEDHFWFRAKKNLLSILLSKVPYDKATVILDIGAGTGGDIAVLKKFGTVHVIDCNKQAIDLIPTNSVASKTIGNACSLPYKDDTFDIIIALDVLEHIEDDKQALTEIYRVLKKNGFFIFTVPAYQILYSTHDKYLGHIRRYNKTMLKQQICCFKKFTLGSWLFFLFPIIAIIRLTTKNHPLNNRQKKPSILVNYMLYNIMSCENWLIKKGIRFPWGLSLYGIYQKK